MVTFLIWISIIAVSIGIYCIVLWKRSKSQSRFRARLTILFFLFVLIPTIPLTLFVSYLLTQSAEMLLLPGVEEALSESLDVMRFQLEQPGQTFINYYLKTKVITSEILNSFNITLINEYQRNSNHIIVTRQVASEDSFRKINTHISMDDWQNIQKGERTSVNYEFNSRQFLERYYVCSDSMIVGVNYPIDIKIIQARDGIYWALKNYTSLRLLQDTFIKENLIWGISVLFILLLTFLSIYVAKTTSKGISEPVHELATAMERLGTGDLSHRLDIHAKDEIAILVDSFNRMAGELKLSRENLQKAERAAAWRDVARRVSHEIKNPLTPIQISMYRLRSSLPENFQVNEDFDQSFKTIMEEIESLRRLADEFSQFARMPKLSPAQQDINEILKSSVLLFEGESRKIKFKLDLDAGVPLLQLDRELMKRAIHNLVKNAIEASYQGDFIEIHTKVLSNKHKIRIDIVDHGHGMTEEVLRQANEPYFTTKEGGTGLGLSITQRIISEHGGEIEIQSKENQGTTISIFL